jgi:hypothetical protein
LISVIAGVRNIARAKAQVPARRIHVSGQSVVTIDGTNFYLGPHNEAKTLARYAVLIQAYQENGSKLPDGFSIEDVRALTDGLFGSEVASANQTESPVLLRHVTAGYREQRSKEIAEISNFPCYGSC